MGKALGEVQSGLGTPVLLVGRSALAGDFLPDGCGFSATPCPDASNAIKILRQGHHQAVLVDLETPGARSKGLLNSVCTNFPDVAVVVATPPHKLRHGILAMMAGASGYVQTPLQPESVAASLNSALKRKQLDTAARG